MSSSGPDQTYSLMQDRWWSRRSDLRMWDDVWEREEYTISNSGRNHTYSSMHTTIFWPLWHTGESHEKRRIHSYELCWHHLPFGNEGNHPEVFIPMDSLSHCSTGKQTSRSSSCFHAKSEATAREQSIGIDFSFFSYACGFLCFSFAFPPVQRRPKLVI